MNKKNSNITFQGKPLKVSGEPIQEGSKMPEFTITGQDLQDIKSDQFKGKVLILSVVPSLDTEVCSIQTKRLNVAAEELGDEGVVLTVSMDLPFAQKRWCGAQGMKNMLSGSDYKYRSFGPSFGAHIDDIGLLTRSVFVVDKKGTVVHVEYVQELTQEPDYAAAIAKANMAM